MKSLIKAYWKGIAIFLVVVFCFSWIGISNCSKTSSSSVVQNAITSDLRASLIDSVQTAVLVAKNAEIDTLKAKEAMKTEAAILVAEYWKGKANVLGSKAAKYKNKADSLANAYTGTECNELIGAFRQANDTLKAENTALKNENEALDVEAEGYSRQLYLCETQNVINDTIIASKIALIAKKDNTIAVQAKALAKKENIFKKAEKWVFGVVGAVGAILIMK